jgi:hypothetical protein
MVNTRSGHEVVHVEASYGRAARRETKRRRRKRKLNLSISTSAGREDDGADGTSTPKRRRTRAQIQEMTELATPPSASTRAATTPPTRSTRLLRGRLPRCSDFGLHRHFAFQGRQKYFFCNPCDLWDARLPDCSKKMSSDSRRYACTAGHSCFSHPTSLRKDYRCTTGSQAYAMATDSSSSLFLHSTDDEEEQHNAAADLEACEDECTIFDSDDDGVCSATLEKYY